MFTVFFNCCDVTVNFILVCSIIQVISLTGYKFNLFYPNGYITDQ